MSEVTTHSKSAADLMPARFPTLEPVLLERFVLGELLGLGEQLGLDAGHLRLRRVNTWHARLFRARRALS